MLRGLVATVAIAALVIGLIVWPVVRLHHFKQQFEFVHVGDDEGTVIRTMGRPWKVTACGEYSGSKPEGCSEEFVYAHPYARWVPRYWVVDFDGEKRVISSVEVRLQ